MFNMKMQVAAVQAKEHFQKRGAQTQAQAKVRLSPAIAL